MLSAIERDLSRSLLSSLAGEPKRGGENVPLPECWLMLPAGDVTGGDDMREGGEL